VPCVLAKGLFVVAKLLELDRVLGIEMNLVMQEAVVACIAQLKIPDSLGVMQSVLRRLRLREVQPETDNSIKTRAQFLVTSVLVAVEFRITHDLCRDCVYLVDGGQMSFVTLQAPAYCLQLRFALASEFVGFQGSM
jgi:hypothetical protein